MNVLLLDAHTVQSISVARSLKEKGHRVIGFIEARVSYGYCSRYIDEKILCPILSKHQGKYLDFLTDFLEKHTVDVIIPMYNDSAELLSSNKKDIESRFEVSCAIPDYDVFVKAHNKESLMQLCREQGLPHPRTAPLSKENIKDAISYVGFPALIKPNISSGARGIVIVNNEEELNAKWADIEQHFGRCTLQQYIDHSGVYYNVMLYRDSKGLCHETVIIRIMRYFPLKGGTSCYCETIEDEHLIKVCERALEKLDWEGFADFDIMETKQGEYKIIEINPRVPASIHAAYVSGVDYSEMMLCDAKDLEIPHYNYQPNKALRFWGLDVMWFIFSKDRFRFRPSWFRFWGENVFYQDGSKQDPLPMIAGVLSGVLKYLNPEYRKSKIKS